MKCLASTFILLAVLGPSTAAAQAPAEKPPEKTARVSGQVFGDLYWIPANHDSSFDDQNGFWFRRIYLTYDRDLDQELGVRFRLEALSPSLNEPSDRLRPFVKDAYLRWAWAGRSIFIGLSPTPAFEPIESIWPRAVEKTPLDLQRLADTRDFGLGLKGAFGAAKQLVYHVMVGTGSGTRSEADRDKKLYGALTMKPAGGWTLQAYGDWESRRDGRDRLTLAGLAVYEEQGRRAALQLAHQRRKQGVGEPDLGLDLLSASGSERLTERLAAFARLDRMFDPNPEGDRIPYLAFDPGAPSNLAILGLDFKPSEAVHVMPNLEVVFYDRVRGVRPDTDVINRLTIYFTF